MINSIPELQGAKYHSWLQPAYAREKARTVPTKLPVSKKISLKALEQYKSITVTVEEDGKKATYVGVPLRVMLAEMLPELGLESMPGWHALSEQELVIEVKGDDGYPGLVTATEVAINKTGDRFLLATQKDGKPFKSAVQLICKMDESRTRCVRQIVSLRVVSVAK
jgi:hypothetical protein